MGEIKSSTRLISVMLLSIPLSFGMSALCESILVMQGQFTGWVGSIYLINVFVAWVVACLVGWFLDPAANFGAPLASQHAQPDTPQFALWLNGVTNAVYALIMSVVLVLLNTQVLVHVPFLATVVSFLANLIPIWLVCFAVALIFRVPCERLARLICEDPADTQGGWRGLVQEMLAGIGLHIDLPSKVVPQDAVEASEGEPEDEAQELSRENTEGGLKEENEEESEGEPEELCNKGAEEESKDTLDEELEFELEN